MSLEVNKSNGNAERIELLESLIAKESQMRLWGMRLDDSYIVTKCEKNIRNYRHELSYLKEN